MRKLLVLVITFIFIKVNSFNAAIAVFPFEDLSKDLNGLDLKISTMIANKLVDNGFDVIYPMEIMEYLERRNIPIVGWVDKINSIKILKIFHCNLIIVGTIFEMNSQTNEFLLGIRLISLPGFQLKWGKLIAITKGEQISFLDLKKKSWGELINLEIDKVLKDIPSVAFTKIVNKPEIDIQNTEIFPKYVRSGRKIVCKGKFRISGKYPDNIFIEINNKKYKPILKKDIFILQFKSPKKENRYPIILICKWQEPFNITKRIFIGSFFVDNQKPEIHLNYKYANKIQGKLFFSKFLKIFPKLRKKEHILKWKFQIFSISDNKTITEIKNYGDLPKYYIWKGLTSRGAILPNGKYRLILQVWDKAENFSKTYLDIFLIKSIIPPTVIAEKEDKKIKIIFNFKNHPVKISLCDIEIFDGNGNLIANKISYNGFIKKIIIPRTKGYKKLFYSINIRDILGNKLKLKKILIEIKKIKKKKKIEKIWLNEF